MAEVINLIDDDDVTEVERGKKPGTKSIFCCNFECRTRDGLLNAPLCVLSYYGAKDVKDKIQKVCDTCYNTAMAQRLEMVHAIEDRKPVFEIEFPPKKDNVLITDSDDELEDDEELDTGTVKFFLDNMDEVLKHILKRCDIDFQLTQAKMILNEKLDAAEESLNKQLETLDSAQKNVDEMRKSWYEMFQPTITEMPHIDIMDLQSPEIITLPTSPTRLREQRRQIQDPLLIPDQSAEKETPLRGIAVKKVTQVNLKKVQEPKITTDVQEVVTIGEMPPVPKPQALPPLGEIPRPDLFVGTSVYIMKNSLYGHWTKGKITEILPKDDETLFKVKLDFYRSKSNAVKYMKKIHLAYTTICPVQFPVGTRVIAVFDNSESNVERYYAGIIAEPPKSLNNYRYLVFFDDGYAQYVYHNKILLVCESSKEVWEDIDVSSREFVRKYLEQYPERPMVKLQPNQIVKTEWNGKWWVARVMEIDGSLVKMYFDADRRSEWIYRGSTRLGPLYAELKHAAARQEMGALRHRGLGLTALKVRNEPYVEYTHGNEAEESKSDSDTSQVDTAQTDTETTQVVSRSVAKKSTTQLKLKHDKMIFERKFLNGKVEKLKLQVQTKLAPFRFHICGSKCIEQYPYDQDKMRGQNPLMIPMLLGWQRHIRHFQGKKVVVYMTPCGRCIRNKNELHAYLQATVSNMSVDLFDFDFWVCCVSEYTVKKFFVFIKDLSYGAETVPISCVNTIDSTLPDCVTYSSKRDPTAGVYLNTDPEFLIGCECDDDCVDQEKCACWQLTIQGAILHPSGTGIDQPIGYVYKRLPDPVPTGIFECNSRCTCCKDTCLNRVVQHPLQLKLQVFKTTNRGWGIRCLNDIPHGGFICIYTGKLLTEQSANEGAKDYGDEYLAELDYIETIERIKEGYESGVEEFGDLVQYGTKTDRNKIIELSGSEDESDEEKKSNSSGDEFQDTSKSHSNKGSSSNSDNNTIVVSDDEDRVELRRPSRFAVESKLRKESSTDKCVTPVERRSIRELYGQDESIYIIDAKSCGNIGRYLNHSCSPNIFVQNVFVDTHDFRFPWVAFFALSHIPAGNELTWDYNYDIGSVAGKKLYCQCGSSNCRGRLL